MIFAVFLDPDSIREADEGGEWAHDHLIGVMRGLMSNCLFAETESYRVEQETGAAIKAIADPNLKTRLAALFEKISIRGQFCVMINDAAHAYDAPLGGVAVADRANELLDCIITSVAADDGPGVEVVSLQRFHSSDFEGLRHRSLTEGTSIEPDQIDAKDLFPRLFGRLLHASKEFSIVDKQIGRGDAAGYLNSNFYVGLEHWAEFFRAAPHPVTVSIVTECANPNIKRAIEERLEELTDQHVVTFKLVEIANLPHERFLRIVGDSNNADQNLLRGSKFSFNIGRGIDLCDQAGRNNDICVTMSN